LSVAACSTPQVASEAPTRPSDAAVAEGIQKAFTEIKLPGTPLVSPIRAAHPLAPGPWILCLKSSAPDQPRRYAIFFDPEKFIHSRLAVVIDRCEQETYAPPTK
jgi:hypothetical protein